MREGVPASSRKAKKAQIRQSEIVDAAMGLFAVRGYAGTTVGGIIDSLGVAKGCFYHHFASKDEVFAACVARLGDRFAAEFIGVLTDSSSWPHERVVAYVEAGYRSHERADAAQLLGQLHGDDAHRLHALVLDSVEHRVLPELTEVVDQGRTMGEFEFPGSAELAAVTVIGALRAVHERYAHRTDADTAAPMTTVLATVERILGHDAASPRSDT